LQVIGLVAMKLVKLFGAYDDDDDTDTDEEDVVND
jgi:hypothetical protein